MPTVTDYELDRFYVSDTRNGELIFDPIRVNTGLNLDYNEHGEEGYQPIYRPLPRNVDELRTANKSRISYRGVTIPGMKGYKIPVQGDVSKIDPTHITKMIWEICYEHMVMSLLHVFEIISSCRQHRKKEHMSAILVQPGNGRMGDIGLTGQNICIRKYVSPTKLYMMRQ